jgi:TatD DNase family protein
LHLMPAAFSSGFLIGWYNGRLEYAYTFGDPSRLYLNATNRCTNRCTFCVRYQTEGLAGAILWGGEEPDFPMLQADVRRHGGFEELCEFIWCGFGEPTFRLDLIQMAAPWLRSKGAKIRLNTNGHGCLIHGRDILPALSQSVDEVSVSLNAPNPQKYLELCRPDFTMFSDSESVAATPAVVWDAMLDFLSRAPAFFKNVQASVVGFALAEEEIEQCRSLVHSIGVKNFRVR